MTYDLLALIVGRSGRLRMGDATIWPQLSSQGLAQRPQGACYQSKSRTCQRSISILSHLHSPKQLKTIIFSISSTSSVTPAHDQYSAASPFTRPHFLANSWHYHRPRLTTWLRLSDERAPHSPRRPRSGSGPLCPFYSTSGAPSRPIAGHLWQRQQRQRWAMRP